MPFPELDVLKSILDNLSDLCVKHNIFYGHGKSYTSGVGIEAYERIRVFRRDKIIVEIFNLQMSFHVADNAPKVMEKIDKIFQIAAMELEIIHRSKQIKSPEP